MWYLVLSRREAVADEVGKVSPQHLEWMQEQHNAGKVLFSGPTPDRSIGIYVVHASSLAEAESLVGTDPFHAKNLRKPEILEWEIHQVLGAGTFGPARQVRE